MRDPAGVSTVWFPPAFDASRRWGALRGGGACAVGGAAPGERTLPGGAHAAGDHGTVEYR